MRTKSLYDDRVQDAIVALLVELGPRNPLGTTESIVRKFPPRERILMLMEKLPRRMREEERCQQ